MPRLFVDQLTVIDCSILDPQRGLIGASWCVDIELQGDLDQQSMVFDFAKVKKTIKNIIDEEVDHKLLIPSKFSGLTTHHGQDLEIRFTDLNKQTLIHRSPSSAVCKINSDKVDHDSVVEYLHNAIFPALPNNVVSLNIELRKEEAPGHYYCYSHGLKKHDGNCQRIAHGHRSQIQVWRNGERNNSLEEVIARDWTDIYIGTQDDVVEDSTDSIRFAYTTNQGAFSLELPARRVHLMDADSTVECIADHLLDMIENRLQASGEAPDSDHLEIRVKAYEGIGKGAIACR